MSEQKPIHFILTGGTIDKSYDPLTEKPELKGMSMTPYYLQNIVKLYAPMSYESPFLIDSLDMTDTHRADILAAVEKSGAEKIIIVHGTSTMDVTAKYLNENLKDSGRRTIILTGAMIPLKEFVMSDGGFNLGYAVGEVQRRDPGIYVCMNGRTFEAGNVRKNLGQGRFEGA